MDSSCKGRLPQITRNPLLGEFDKTPPNWDVMLWEDLSLPDVGRDTPDTDAWNA